MTTGAKIEIETPKGKVKVEYRYQGSSEGLADLTDFLADNPNLIDIFGFASQIAERKLHQKIKQERIISNT